MMLREGTPSKLNMQDMGDALLLLLFRKQPSLLGRATYCSLPLLTRKADSLLAPVTGVLSLCLKPHHGQQHW